MTATVHRNRAGEIIVFSGGTQYTGFFDEAEAYEFVRGLENGAMDLAASIDPVDSYIRRRKNSPRSRANLNTRLRGKIRF